MLDDSPPPMSQGGFKFYPHRSSTTTTRDGDSAKVLGARMNPKLRESVDRTTIKDKHTCNPHDLRDYSVGNVVAVPNPFYDAELEGNELPLYIVTNPYEVNEPDHRKYKLIPLNQNVNYIRIYGKTNEQEVTLLANTGRAQPTEIRTVPDVIVADACGSAEQIINRRI